MIVSLLFFLVSLIDIYHILLRVEKIQLQTQRANVILLKPNSFFTKRKSGWKMSDFFGLGETGMSANADRKKKC